MNSLISVIVPVYNVENYLPKCLETISQQTFKNIEIIIIDDGSTDDSGKICDEFATGELRAKVFHKKNGGLSSARNFGISKSKGDYLAFIDSDDYVSKDFIEKLYFAAIDTGAEIVICGYNNTKPGEKILTGRKSTIDLLTKQENIEILTWNKLYARRLFIDCKIEFPVGKKHEDTLTTYKLLAAASKVAYITDNLYHYRERANSITGSEKIEERLMAREQAATEAVGYFKNDEELESAAKVCLLLAKYAFLDYALFDKIDLRYGNSAKKWICNNHKEFADNKYMTKKLKIYNYMVCNFGGVLYKIFRKVVHK